MFGFANALLLLLLAAACLDFVPVLRRRLSPAAWWAEERPLFSARGAAVRQRYGTAAFLLGVMVYEFIVVFNNSMAPGRCILWRGGSTSTGRISGGWGFALPCWPQRMYCCAAA